MVGFFSDFKFVRNFFSSYLRPLDIEKINLSHPQFPLFAKYLRQAGVDFLRPKFRSSIHEA